MSTLTNDDGRLTAVEPIAGESLILSSVPQRNPDDISYVRPSPSEPRRDNALRTRSNVKTTKFLACCSREPDASTHPAKRRNIIADFRRKCRDDVVYSDNLRHSLCLALALFALGVTESQNGPTFLDLQIITGTDVGQASTFFTSHSCGYLLGSTISGYLSGRKINASLTLLVNMLAMGTAVILMPYCSIFGAMVAMRGLTGIFGGFIDTTANAVHMRIWGKDGPVLMQLLHFCFAVGGVVSPLVTEPFLAEREDEVADLSQNSSSTNSIEDHGRDHLANGSHVDNVLFQIHLSNQSTSYNHSRLFESNISSNYNVMHQDLGESRETNVHWAFLITGIIVILSSIPFIFLYRKSKQVKKQARTESNEQNKVSHRKIPLYAYVLSAVGLGAFYVFYCSVEDTFANFLMTFVVRRFKTVSKSDGAHITAVYWGSFAASRFLMIFVSRALSPVRVLYLGGSLMLLSFTGFALSSGPWVGGGGSDSTHVQYVNASHGVSNSLEDGTTQAAGDAGGSVPALTFFAAMAGLAMSGVFPAGISWSGAELIEVTGRVSSCVFISASIGAMLNPLLVSRLMQDVSNMWFCYVLLLEVSGLVLVFCTLLAFNRCFLNQRYGKLHNSDLDVVVAGALADVDEADDRMMGNGCDGYGEHSTESLPPFESERLNAVGV